MKLVQRGSCFGARSASASTTYCDSVVRGGSWVAKVDARYISNVAGRCANMARMPLKAPLKPIGKGARFAPMLTAAELAWLATRHVGRLDSFERRRLIALARKSHGRPGALSKAERAELGALLAALEPRLFVGSAVKRLSPVPLPKRLLFGPRGSHARIAAGRQRSH